MINCEITSFSMWLANYTQAEIAAAVDVDQKTISNWEEDFRNFGNLTEFSKSLANHAVEFEAPIYSIIPRSPPDSPHPNPVAPDPRSV
jgi:transcriptional regulator with XRE-family HTH domain